MRKVIVVEMYCVILALCLGATLLLWFDGSPWWIVMTYGVVFVYLCVIGLYVTWKLFKTRVG